jgi:hypothetical protein
VSSLRRLLATAVILGACLVGVASCGDDQGSGGSTTSRTIEITFADGTVTPNGERVKVKVGQPIELVVKADTGGEIHVHSSPEQELTYGGGTTTLRLTIDKAGVVDVESHDLDQVIVQLEVE